MHSYLIPIYSARLPIQFIKGQGIWLWDNEQANEPYLDALSGRGVSNLGHSHPAVTHTIQQQAAQLLHTSNLYTLPQQVQLATELCQRSAMSQAFFSNSGAEAIEAALKLAWFHAHKKSITAPLIIALTGSYHGRSAGALAVSGSGHLQAERAAMIGNSTQTILHVPLNDTAQLQKIVQTYASRIAAIVFEPVQGDGGIYPISPNFLHMIRQLCDHYDCLMIADEIQTGLCRTGRWLACQHADVIPDIVVLAKALGNGIPIGAYLVRGKAQGLLDGRHGSTFAGNPLACATALTVIHTLETEKLAEQAEITGQYLLQQLKGHLAHLPQLREIRGQGLMIGIELDYPCLDIIHQGIKHRLLFDVVAHHTIRLLPPLILSLQEADELILRLEATLKAFHATIR